MEMTTEKIKGRDMNSLESWRRSDSGLLGKSDEFLSVVLCLELGLFQVPNGLHSGVVGTDLVFRGLVGIVALHAPVDPQGKSGPAGELDQRRDLSDGTQIDVS
eukprot:TRINITY_DN1023_c0_g1_i1.p1 TRINITY_DN1023_c0_g1~~TRINITY_DN1023_c0_g1_i1.p1  ORF type:complete len:103 (+),score=16.03 TRINITY_DN1023_c0_g1_i1:327-635(+)